MAEKWEIRNEALPENFFHMVTTCGQNCGNCSSCKKLFERFVRPKVFELPDLRRKKRR
jgi:hypothetical protein